MAMRQAFRQKMTTGVFSINQVEIGDVVDDAAIDLLGHIQIERPVAGLHVVDRNFHPLRHDSGDRRIGIAENQHRVGFFEVEHLLDLDQSFSQHMSQTGSIDPQIIIRLAQLKFFEKYLIEFVIVILAGVNHLVIHVFLQQFDHGGQPDDLGTGPDN